jgi:hypothetical protein
MSDDEGQNPSRQYWKAAISCLPTAEKRDAAWEFYLEKLAGGGAGETLSGLILLLEANGVFLLTLPEKFHGGLTQPITEQLSALREELRNNVERQRTSLRAADVANESLEKANQLLAGASAELANKVQAAVRQIDVIALAKQVHVQLEASTIAPLRFALRDLPEQSRQITAASNAAASSVQTWRQVHLGGIILNVSLAAILAGSLLIGCGWFRLQRHFNERLAAEIARLTEGSEAFKEAALLDVPVHLMPSSDQNGNPIPGGYAFVIDQADDAAMQPKDGQKRGVIFFKAQRPIDQINDLRGLLDDLQKSKER